MADVIHLNLTEVGENFRFNPDDLLDAAKGRLKTVAIIGEAEDGSIWVSGSANVGETVILLERAKRQICFGDV